MKIPLDGGNKKHQDILKQESEIYRHIGAIIDHVEGKRWIQEFIQYQESPQALFLEFYCGEDLKKRLRKGLELHQKMKIVTGIALGLAFFT